MDRLGGGGGVGGVSGGVFIFLPNLIHMICLLNSIFSLNFQIYLRTDISNLNFLISFTGS